MTSSGQTVALGKGGALEIRDQTLQIANHLRGVDKINVLTIKGRKWRIPKNSEIRRMRVDTLRQAAQIMSEAALASSDFGRGGNPGDHPIVNSWARIQSLSAVKGRRRARGIESFFTETVSDIGGSAPDEPPKQVVPEQKIEWIDERPILPTDPVVPQVFSQVDIDELINGDPSMSFADAELFIQARNGAVEALEEKGGGRRLGGELVQGGTGGSMIPSAPVLDIADDETADVPINLWVDADSPDDQAIGDDPLPPPSQAWTEGEPVDESKYDEVNDPAAAGMVEQPWIGGEEKTPAEGGGPAPYDVSAISNAFAKEFLPASQSAEDRDAPIPESEIIDNLALGLEEAKRVIEAGISLSGEQLSQDQISDLRGAVAHGTAALDQARSAGGLGAALEPVARAAISEAGQRLGGDTGRAVADAATNIIAGRSGADGDLAGAPAVAMRDVATGFGSSALEHGPGAMSVNDQLSRLWISDPWSAHQISTKIKRHAVEPVSTKRAHRQIDVVQQANAAGKAYSGIFNTTYS